MGRLDLTNKRFDRLVALDIGKVVQKELADIAIVCAGIYRFDQHEALRLMSRAYMACEILGFKMSDLDKEVNRKWQINLKRKWKWNGKTYHHIEEK